MRKIVVTEHVSDQGLKDLFKLISSRFARLEYLQEQQLQAITTGAKPWLDQWQYRIPIEITNNSNIDLENYQVLIVLNTQSLISAGKMRNDGGDIRFTRADGTTKIPYYLESGINTSSTRIWVNVPFIPANGKTTIYMYYGNSTATSESNPTAVFDYFDDDDFSDFTTSYWVTQEEIINYSVTKVTDVKYSGTHSLRLYLASSAPAWVQVSKQIYLSFQSRIELYWKFRGYDNTSGKLIINNVVMATISYPGYGETAWTQASANITTTGLTTFAFRLEASDITGDNYLWIDRIIIRKYVSPEPSYTLKSEETK